MKKQALKFFEKIHGAACDWLSKQEVVNLMDNYTKEDRHPEVRIYPETIVLLLGIFIAGICIGAAIANS